MTAPISQITVYSNASVLGSTLVTVGTFPVDNSSQRSATLRGENCVKICFKAGQSIAIPAFSFIEYDGQLFFLKETYRPVPKGNSYYEYNMKFVSFDNMLSKPQAYRKVVVGSGAEQQTWNEPDIDVVGNLADIATIIKDSIIETAGRYEGVFADMLSKVELVNEEININSESKAFSYSGQKISQVLDAIANEYEIDYWFEQVGDTQNGITKMILHFAKCEILSGDLHVTDKTSPSNPFDKLHPTVSGGLDECTFSNEWSGVVQRITPFGSERNIKRGQAIANDMFVSFGKRLRLEYDHSCTIDGTTYQHAYAVKNEDGDLEPLYVDENGAVYVPGVTTGEETIEKYDDIYPRGHFRVTHVTQRGVDTQIYTVYAIPTVERNGQFVDLTNAEIDAMQADPTKKLFPIDIADGQTLSLHFETGYLNGREFEVANKTAKMTWNGSAYEVDPDNGHWVACFEINPEGDNNDSPQVPYGNLIPRGKFDSTTGYEGDMFAIFNMDMPAFYVEDAQNELAQKAYDEIVSILATRPEVKCKGNEVYFKNHSLFLGQRIFVKSDLFGQDNQGQPLEFISRVTNYSHPLSKPNNVDFRLCSSRVQGAISVMKGAIADQTSDIMGVGQTARSLSRRAFRDAQEMIGMLQAVVAEMMVVGVERNQFQFTMGIECLKATGSDGIMHFDGLKITAGELQHTQEPYIKDAWEGHYSLLSETTLKADHNGNAIDKSATDTYRNTPYYLYAVINSSTGHVSMELWADKKDGENDEAYLLLGILSSEFLDGTTSLRVFNRSNGFTQIAGGTITTEQLQDPTRQLIIDMSSNPPRIIAKRGAQIIGNITFISSEGTETNLATKIGTMDGDISTAKQNAADAMQKALDITNDGIISGGTEKQVLNKEFIEIAGESRDGMGTDGSYAKAVAQATDYGVEHSDLDAAYNELLSAMKVVLGTNASTGKIDGSNIQNDTYIGALYEGRAKYDITVYGANLYSGNDPLTVASIQKVFTTITPDVGKRYEIKINTVSGNARTLVAIDKQDNEDVDLATIVSAESGGGTFINRSVEIDGTGHILGFRCGSDNSGQSWELTGITIRKKTKVNAAEFNALWKNYYDAEIALLNAVSDVIDEREIGGENLYTKADPLKVEGGVSVDTGITLTNDQSYVVSINSSNGTYTGTYVYCYEDSDGTLTRLGNIKANQSAREYVTFKGHGGNLVFRIAQGTAADKFLNPVGIMVQKGEKPTAYQSSYKFLAEAFEHDATKMTTSIDGGLIIAALMKLMNAQGYITAGISGLDDGLVLWGGGTYAQALSDLAGTTDILPVLLTTNQYGTGTKLGIFKIKKDVSGNHYIQVDDEGTPSILFYNDRSAHEVISQLSPITTFPAGSVQQTDQIKSEVYFYYNDHTVNRWTYYHYVNERVVETSHNHYGYSLDDTKDLLVQQLVLEPSPYTFKAKVNFSPQISATTAGSYVAGASASVTFLLTISNVTTGEIVGQQTFNAEPGVGRSYSIDFDIEKTFTVPSKGTYVIYIEAEMHLSTNGTGAYNTPQTDISNYGVAQGFVKFLGGTLTNTSSRTVLCKDGFVFMCGGYNFTLRRNALNLDLRAQGLPDSDPHVVGQFYTQSQTIGGRAQKVLCVSAG